VQSKASSLIYRTEPKQKPEMLKTVSSPGERVRTYGKDLWKK